MPEPAPVISATRDPSACGTSSGCLCSLAPLPLLLPLPDLPPRAFAMVGPFDQPRSANHVPRKVSVCGGARRGRVARLVEGVGEASRGDPQAGVFHGLLGE